MHVIVPYDLHGCGPLWCSPYSPYVKSERRSQSGSSYVRYVRSAERTPHVSYAKLEDRGWKEVAPHSMEDSYQHRTVLASRL